MIAKRLLRPERLRKVPAQFSWVDHRLVRQNFISRCEPSALAFYLFLVTVADAQGLSYYSDVALGRYLKMDLAQLTAARIQLQQADLIAYEKPLYQVLSLDEPTGGPSDPQRQGKVQSLGEVLRRALGGETP
jgi:hypothetical protein